MQLAGKVAIVTGGATGIGYAIAEALADRGASLVLADIAKAEDAAAKLQARGARAIEVAVDVASERDAAAMADRAISTFGGIDILVNNAGIYASLKPKPFEEIDPAEWRRVMDVNALGVFLCIRAVLPAMKARGAG